MNNINLQQMSFQVCLKLICITVNRITFKKDIEDLQAMGYDIIETRSSQNKSKTLIKKI